MTTKPNINVTPLIDVLLVLLIIFMIISPVKPTDFKATIPQEPTSASREAARSDALIVTLKPDSSFRLNAEKDLGNIQQPEKLIKRLSEIFHLRAENHAYREGAEFRTDLSEADRIEKTVFIKAPRSADYGAVVKVIDAVKTAGANPISLQIDDLD